MGKGILSVVTLLVLSATACLQNPGTDPFGNTIRDPLLEQVWTIILTDDSGNVWIAQSDTLVTAARTRGGNVVSAQLWSTPDGPSEPADLRLWTFRRDGALQWRLVMATTPDVVAAGVGSFDVDSRYFVPRSRGRGMFMWAGTARSVTFDVIGGMPMPAMPLSNALPTTMIRLRARGIVSLRIDDCNVADRYSFRMLRELHLVAEVAVPTGRIDQDGSCSESLLKDMFAAGNSIESHSRLHEGAPSDFGCFYLETVGSFRDLRARGFDPHVFIQPGTWRDGAYAIDSPSKLEGPAGALLRRVYVATEAYAYSSPTVRIPVRGRTGPASLDINYFSPADIKRLAHQAADSGEWLQFMWHSGNQSFSALWARLSVIAALRDSGVIAVVPFYQALHAAPKRPQ
jgi:hypothetical protein